MKAPTGPETTNVPGRSGRDEEIAAITIRHLRFGWWSLLIFLSLGIVLEGLHGFKAGIYLNVSNSTRRLMWTLAHAHGTLLAVVNIVFGVTGTLLPTWEIRSRGLASACLMGGSLLIPSGFFLGGTIIYAGDPGLGILLVPLGAILLFTAVFLTARAAQSRSSASPVEPVKKKK